MYEPLWRRACQYVTTRDGVRCAQATPAPKYWEGADSMGLYWALSNDSGLTWGPTLLLQPPIDNLPLWGPMLFAQARPDRGCCADSGASAHTAALASLQFACRGACRVRSRPYDCTPHLHLLCRPVQVRSTVATAMLCGASRPLPGRKLMVTSAQTQGRGLGTGRRHDEGRG